jgi:membrane-associated phospholipid phosphatase
MLRRRKRRRNPTLAALADADQAALRFLRTHGHHEPVETMMRAIGMCGEYGAVWAAAGAIGASIDHKRRRQWLVGGAAGPLAVGANYLVKLAVRRERPLLDGHPALAKAPSKLSFPSAHATSSLAAATALGRVEPRARPALFTLAAAICVGRPYLGMHYPSDVLAGAALGAVVGALIPGLGAAPT